MTPAPIVSFDIAGPADANLADFYKVVFNWTASIGPNLAVPVEMGEDGRAKVP